MNTEQNDALVDTYRDILKMKSTKATDAKPRGSAGILGKGTPGSRLKARCPAGVPLRVFARVLAAQKPDHPRSKDAIAWLKSKKPVHKKQHAGPHGRGSWSK